MALGDINDTSPSSGGDFTSPDSHGQSEQLNFFKDYYSQDEIRPSDLVSTLWAYEPRAADEFQLERGDMIKVLGIWDDGWATGVRVNERAEEYDPKRKEHRDSGVSSSSGLRDTSSELKAFPLVCVCLPQHWKSTVQEETASEAEVASVIVFLDDSRPGRCESRRSDLDVMSLHERPVSLGAL